MLANTCEVVGTIFGILILAAMLGLPAVGAYLLSRMIHATLKKKASKWAMAAAVIVFIGTYLATLFAIISAMAFAGFFHR